jgi:hypothetical protein
LKVYRLKSEVDRYQYFLAQRREDEAKLVMYGTPKAQRWQPPGVFIYEPNLKAGDFFNFGSSVLITSPEATDILGRYLHAAGELLPLPFEGLVYHVLNVTLCINALEPDSPGWVIGKSTGRRISIRQYSFHADRFPESDLFKIPETCKSEILYVEGGRAYEDSFRHAVEANGLRGLRFEEVWSSD